MKKQIPLASQTFGEVGEHKFMPPEIADDIMVCYSYIEEIDTPAKRTGSLSERGWHSKTHMLWPEYH